MDIPLLSLLAVVMGILFVGCFFGFKQVPIKAFIRGTGVTVMINIGFYQILGYPRWLDMITVIIGLTIAGFLAGLFTQHFLSERKKEVPSA